MARVACEQCGNEQTVNIFGDPECENCGAVDLTQLTEA